MVYKLLALPDQFTLQDMVQTPIAGSKIHQFTWGNPLMGPTFTEKRKAWNFGVYELTNPMREGMAKGN